MLIIYRDLQNNDISVIEDNAFNNLPNLQYMCVSFSVICIDVEPHYVKYKLKVIYI